MKNKKGRKIFNLFKEIVLWGLVIFGFGSVICLLLPGIGSLLIKMLSLSINLVSIALVGTAGIGLIIALGFATGCIKRETVYEIRNTDALEESPEFMRSQLSVVSSNERVEQQVSTEETSKFSYLFDNNYKDTGEPDDVIIDDIVCPYLDMMSGENQGRGYSRRKTNYVGKYLR